MSSFASKVSSNNTNNAYDVICIQETFLKPDKKFSVPAYDVIRTDRDTARGGLVMLLKAGMKYMQLPSPQGIESQVVEVSTANGKLTIYHRHRRWVIPGAVHETQHDHCR